MEGPVSTKEGLLNCAKHPTFSLNPSSLFLTCTARLAQGLGA